MDKAQGIVLGLFVVPFIVFVVYAMIDKKKRENKDKKK